MRVLFTTLARPPHLYPVVPLAWACRAAGHEMRLASSPSFTHEVFPTGLSAVVVGRDIDQEATAGKRTVAGYYSQPRWPDGWPVMPYLLSDAQRALLASVGRTLTVAAEAVLDDLVAFAMGWRPDLVVHDTSSLAGAVTATVLGIPNVSHLSGSASMPRLEMIYLLRRGRVRPDTPPHWLFLGDSVWLPPWHEHVTGWLDGLARLGYPLEPVPRGRPLEITIPRPDRKADLTTGGAV